MNLVPKKVYIGQCIYCRAALTKEDPLQDEHIFPFGIFGKDILLKASCKSCAGKTSAFEGKVQRHDLHGLRTALNFPTRRKQKRKATTTLPIEIVTTSGKTKEIYVPIEDYYAILTLPLFEPPAYLSKRPYKEGIKMIGYATVEPKRSIEEIAAKYDARKISIWTFRYPEAWALMFAKIGYALAIRHYGLERIKPDDTFVLNAILGKSNDIGMWVGCDDQKVFTERHTEASHTAGVWQKNNEIHARIKFFDWLDVPEYLVVVGRLSE
jgi:hypothetical protein